MSARDMLRLFVVTVAAVTLASCASQPRTGGQAQVPARRWPAPPAEPRIAFVQYLRGPADVGQRPSIWRSVAGWITGDTADSLKLRKPFGIGVDEKGNLCITDTDAGVVAFCDFERKQWRCYAGVGKAKFASPVAVARGGGVFYVADSELGRVFAFGDDGKPAFEIGMPLRRPVGLAVAGESLFVVDTLAHSVFVFGLDGKLKFSFGRRGNGPGEFNYPTCVAADKRDHIFVTDTLNSRVEVFDSRGNFLSEFGSNGDTGGHFARPKGVALDAAGHSYVVDGMRDNVQIFDAQARLLLSVGERGDGVGEFGLPNGIAISADNRIFVADTFNHRVQVFKYFDQP